MFAAPLLHFRVYGTEGLHETLVAIVASFARFVERKLSNTDSGVMGWAGMGSWVGTHDFVGTPRV